jgi:hypothetical protein
VAVASGPVGGCSIRPSGGGGFPAWAMMLQIFQLGSFSLADLDLGVWEFFFLEGKHGSCESDPVVQHHFSFLFLADVSIDYWWV